MTSNPTAQGIKLPIVTGGSDPGRDEFVPVFPWREGLDEESLSTKRGFVFQFPPFPALDRTDAEVVDRRSPAGLYVHVPYCPYRCSYCYYAVEVNQGEDEVDAYLRWADREMDLVNERPATRRHQLTTVFFGGGTPTYLDTARLTRLVESVGRRFGLGAVEEFTIESDPTTVTRDKIAAVRALGVNRISIGVQTFNEELNDLNQRRHSTAQTYAAIDAVRGAGIDNLNLDLICGLIGETHENWGKTIDELLAVAPEHVTMYLFSFRPQTGAYVRVGQGKMPMPPEEIDRIRMYNDARDRLLAAGYVQTTPNCFVREPRWEQIHQRNAWSSLPLIGVGNSAYSYIDECVTQNVRSIGAYGRSIEAGRIPVELGHRLNAREQMVRYAVLRLKQLRLDLQDFVGRFGFEVAELCGPSLSRLRELGLVTIDDTSITLTPRGIVYVDDVCRELYTAPVRERLAQIEGSQMPRLVKSLL